MSQRSTARKSAAAFSSPGISRPQNGRTPAATSGKPPASKARPSTTKPAGSKSSARFRKGPPSVPLTERRGFWFAAASATVLAAIVIIGVVAMVAAGPPKPDTSGTAQWPAAPAASSLRDRLAGAGLQVLTSEGTALHIHDHLDVVVNGQPVPVPADVGIDQNAGILSPLHTHDATGVIHVESPVVRDFTLGEFFQVWGVALDQNCIGQFCAGQNAELKMWVNGQPYSGNPADLKLAAHQEIVVAFGTPANMPTNPPATYDWQGL